MPKKCHWALKSVNYYLMMSRWENSNLNYYVCSILFVKLILIMYTFLINKHKQIYISTRNVSWKENAESSAKLTPSGFRIEGVGFCVTTTHQSSPYRVGGKMCTNAKPKNQIIFQQGILRTYCIFLHPVKVHNVSTSPSNQHNVIFSFET